MRHSFCNLELLLEDERKTSKELRSKLKITMSLVNKRNTEYSENTNECIGLKIDYESIKRERDSLHEKFKSIKLQCVELQMKNQLLLDDLNKETTSNKSLQALMNQCEDDIKTNYMRLKEYLMNFFLCYVIFCS